METCLITLALSKGMKNQYQERWSTQHGLQTTKMQETFKLNNMTEKVFGG